MQPYLFPFVSYFQLLKSVDLFVVMDDVNFIKKGWINRNSLSTTTGGFLFSMPVLKQSQNRAIKDHFVDWELFNRWAEKMTVSFNHLKFSDEAKDLFLRFVENANSLFSFSPSIQLSEVVVESIRVVCKKLDIGTEIILSSKLHQSFPPNHQGVIERCKIVSGNVYHNSIGGMELYEKIVFQNQGLELFFLSTDSELEEQYGRYSILDLVNKAGLEKSKELLSFYQLI